jgi:hypothetical protein
VINDSSNAGKITQGETCYFVLKRVIDEVVKYIWFRWDPLAVGIQQRRESKTTKVLLKFTWQKTSTETSTFMEG